MNHQVIDPRFPHLGGNILEGDFATFEPVLWDWLIDRFHVETVLDVGCGCGYSTKWFRMHGCQAIGLDGLHTNVSACGAPALLLDVSQPLPPLMDVDLVWCCEVVEHIEEKHLDNLLRVLRCGTHLALTHADTRQGGHHHVNCKPSKYWIEALSPWFKFLPGASDKGRYKCEPSHHFGSRGLIFERRG